MFERPSAEGPFEGEPGAPAVPEVAFDDSSQRTQPLPMTRLQQGTCSALAPQGWSMYAQPPYAAADLSAPGIHVAWGIRGVTPAAAGYYADAYGDPNGPPETSIAYMASAITIGLGDGRIEYTSQPSAVGEYSYRFFASSSHRGVVVFRLWNLYGGEYVPGQDYIESMYFAVLRNELWDTFNWEGALLIASSIRCTTQLQPSTGSGSRENPDGPRDSDYNRWLGTEYVHDRNGTNYLVDDSQWIENGPAGPGYYRRVGNDYEQLQPGRID